MELPVPDIPMASFSLPAVVKVRLLPENAIGPVPSASMTPLVLWEAVSDVATPVTVVPPV